MSDIEDIKARKEAAIQREAEFSKICESLINYFNKYEPPHDYTLPENFRGAVLHQIDRINQEIGVLAIEEHKFYLSLRDSQTT